MVYKNINKQKEYKKNWYLKNQDKQKIWSSNYKKQKRIWFSQYKSNLFCEICGENNSVCLDFHHNDEKDYDIGNMINLGYSRDKILEEIKKCRVLCANCHRKIHFDKKTA